GVTLIAAELGAGSLVGPGAHLLVWLDRASGTLGDADLDAAAIEVAREMSVAAAPATREIQLPGGGRATVYLEQHMPPSDLVIVGAGHIARPLCSIGAMLGFRVIILDDRPEFATRERFPEATEVVKADFSAPLHDIDLTPSTHLVLVTRGHKYDFDALRDALRRDVQPAYIGMVGSRRRVRAALEMLAREGISDDRLAAVHAPIGLDLGAETPEEIAVAIAAEIVRLRRGGSGESLRDRERVVERWVR
ncbi:MAG TPA: XdhC/CoxI family protein, partial [Longimicrobiaceae bacterium]|nr:XdhC/CoxI family protein [Longimicrobiaceae bacterium]